ncbi:hypothetical protein [Gallaecimonas mangrovi]|uniref:hypothetical protein n=1 Tax=Gallaecimonas mangrovi TaxID=2291597 RepID=UPI000E201F46|nr:hypothetical protein [Gallaecimonas mangrovi]
MASVALFFDPANRFQLGEAFGLNLGPSFELKRHGHFILATDRPQAFIDTPSGPALFLGPTLTAQHQQSLLSKPLLNLAACPGPFVLFAPLGSCYLASSDNYGFIPLFKRQLGASWAVSTDPALLTQLGPMTLDNDILYDCLTLGAPLGDTLFFADIKVLACQHYWLDGRSYKFAKQSLTQPRWADNRPSLPWRMQGRRAPATAASYLGNWLLGDAELAQRRQQQRLVRQEHLDKTAFLQQLWRWHWQHKAASIGIDLYQWSLPGLNEASNSYPPAQHSVSYWSLLRRQFQWQLLWAYWQPSAIAPLLAAKHWLFKKTPLT